MKQYLKIIMAHAALAASVDVSGVLRGFGAPGEESTGGVDVSKLNLRAGLEMVGVTGVLPIACTLDGSVISFVTPKMNAGVNRLHVELTYGTNTTAILDVDLFVPQGATGQETHELSMRAVETLGGEGGGGDDYTTKHLLTNTVGEETIKDENGNILTHAQIYDMLMNTPDFVVLVRADHAFHPNLVTETQIAFTCSYLGADGKISAERVNITSENVVTYTSGKGVTADSNGNVSIGTGVAASYTTNAFASGVRTQANGYGSHAEGEETVAASGCAHAEGANSSAIGSNSHAEGVRCKTGGGTSHAEGYYSETGAAGGSAHAEGSYTNANGAASHTEGYRTITTEGGSHAQGCWNKVEGGQYAFMHGCGTSNDDRANAFLIAGDGSIYVIGLGGYNGTNSDTALSLQELFGTSNIQASANEAVNGYQVPDLTAEQVTQAYNAVVAGRSVTVTDATGNYHLGVTQADVLNGDLAISLIYLNAMLLTYEISGSSVDIQFKNL